MSKTDNLNDNISRLREISSEMSSRSKDDDLSLSSKKITSSSAPKAIGPYHQATTVNNMLFVSGQIGLDPQTGELVGAGIKEQTLQCLANIKAIVNEADFGKVQIVRMVIYLTDINDFEAFNEAYGSFFKKEAAPARTTVAVSALPKNAKVEIEATAVREHAMFLDSMRYRVARR